MIEEAYCSFEIAKLLKEKGFDESCRAYWDVQPALDSRTLFWTIEPHKHYDREVCAPTHQVAMAWLRKIHNIIFVFKPASFSGEECTSWTYEIWAGDNFEGETMSFKTYEEAVEAALKYSLENLI